MARDLSAFSLRELREMLKAMTFYQNGDALGVEKVVIKNQVEKKSETQAAVDEDEKEVRRLEELRKEKQEKMPDEAEKKSGAKMQEEKIEGKTEWQPVMSFEAKRSDSLSSKETETEKKAEAELVEAGKQLKLQPFSVEEKFEEGAGNNVKKELKLEAFQALHAINIATCSSKIEVQQIDFAGTKVTMKMKPTYVAGNIRVKCWRYDKQRRRRKRSKV